MSDLKKKINKLTLELTESKENKKNQLITGFKLLCLSLIGIISGPVLVQIGIIENDELLNIYCLTYCHLIGCNYINIFRY